MGILTDDMQRVVDRELGFVATVGSRRDPQPLAEGDHRGVGRRPPRLRRSAIAGNDREPARRIRAVEVNVVDQLVRKGYRLKGTAVVHTEGEDFERGVQFYERAGWSSARERIHSIVVIEVERAPRR